MTIPDIDAAISGTLLDWIRLQGAALADPRVLRGILVLCEARAHRQCAGDVERYRAWRAYADTCIAADDRLEVPREAWWDATGT
jgi:hypothetical protein